MNTSDTNILYTETPDRTPDVGPVKRGGTMMWFWAVMCALLALGGAAALAQNENHRALCWLPLIAFGIPAAWCVWSIYRNSKDRVPAPRSHNMLAGELGFDVAASCQGVVSTAFFMSDTVVHGGSTSFHLFVENLMSRQRILTVRLGHLPGIGRPEATYVKLHLAAGQAAVYAMPVHSKPEMLPGFHRLSVLLTAEMPTGVGQRLAGTRTHIHKMRKLRGVAPFEVVGGRPDAARMEALKHHLEAPRYLSLASVSEKEPDLDRLHELVGKS